MSQKSNLQLAALPEHVQMALECALERKALGPVILHVTKLAGYTDWVIILSASSQRHAQGITDAIIRGLRGAGRRPLGTDGLTDHLWALLDYDEFIVHVFFHPVREYYDLESMWSDAPRVELELPAEVMDTSVLSGAYRPEPGPESTDDQFAGYDDEFDDDDSAFESPELEGEDTGEYEDEYADLDEDAIYDDEVDPQGDLASGE